MRNDEAVTPGNCHSSDDTILSKIGLISFKLIDCIKDNAMKTTGVDVGYSSMHSLSFHVTVHRRYCYCHVVATHKATLTLRPL